MSGIVAKGNLCIINEAASTSDLHVTTLQSCCTHFFASMHHKNFWLLCSQGRNPKLGRMWKPRCILYSFTFHNSLRPCDAYMYYRTVSFFGSGNGLPPVRYQAVLEPMLTLSFEPCGANLNDILIKKKILKDIHHDNMIRSLLFCFKTYFINHNCRTVRTTRINPFCLSLWLFFLQKKNKHNKAALGRQFTGITPKEISIITWILFQTWE